MTGGAEVTISVPEGEAIAHKTFNPQMGIEGGISILGTSGIVEPMSMQAMIDTMAIELRQAAAQGHRKLILTPGNYGQDFLTRHGLDGLGVPVVKCANFIGDALDQAAAEGFERRSAGGPRGQAREAGRGHYEHPQPLRRLPDGTILRLRRRLRRGTGAV